MNPVEPELPEERAQSLQGDGGESEFPSASDEATSVEADRVEAEPVHEEPPLVAAIADDSAQMAAELTDAPRVEPPPSAAPPPVESRSETAARAAAKIQAGSVAMKQAAAAGREKLRGWAERLGPVSGAGSEKLKAASQKLRGRFGALSPRNRWIVGGAAGALGIALLSGLIYLIASDSESDVDSSMLLPVVTPLTVQKEELVRTVAAPGTVTFLEKAAVVPKVVGRIQTLFAEQGMSVKKGERLAQLETFELEIQMRQAQARVNAARAQRDVSRARYNVSRREVDRQIRDLERMQSDIIEAKAGYLNARRNLENKQEIYELGGISREELKSVYTDYLSAMSRYFQSRKNYQIRAVGFRDEDLRSASMNVPENPVQKREIFVDFNTQVEREDVRAADANVRNAELELDSIRLMIKESTLVSPLDGVVASRALDVGESVKQDEPVFTVVRMDRLLVSINIAESDLKLIEVDQPVLCTVDAWENEPREGKVKLISPIIDAETRTAEVRIDLDNAELRLNPGMFVRCSVDVETKADAVAIPETALVDRREENEQKIAEVYVLQNGLAFRRQVTLGGQFGERVEITGGLQPGEQIAADNVDALREGSKVRLREESPLDPASPRPETRRTREDPTRPDAAPANKPIEEQPREEKEPQQKQREEKAGETRAGEGRR
jgi:RND family efflux transporter MFP subunit